MKKTMFILIAAAFVLGIAAISYAQTSAFVNASATVVNELRLTASVFQVDSKNTETFTDDTWATSPTTTMSFGTLTHLLANGDEAGLLFSKPYYYIAQLGAFTSGRKYRITSTCIGLIGPATLTKGFGVTNIDVDPKKADGSPINPTASVGTPGTVGPATVSGKVLFDSGPTGASRVIAAYYGIPPYATGATTLPGGIEPIPTDTPAGSYSGTVTFNLTLY